ncbi:MAG: hypothetical protein WD042_19650 [Phycisphaeraceae bacterium]
MSTSSQFAPGFTSGLTLTLRPGTLADYAALCEHHYKSGRPATATRVLVLAHTRPSVVGRFLHRPAEEHPAAVLVESLPSLACRMRDAALGNRYGAIRNLRQRALLLNSELRCISRVVVHPQWRGLGLAVRLVRHALTTATTLYTEALAAMGKVNPFFTRAGMTAYPRPTHGSDARLLAALQHAGIAPIDLALLDRTWQHIEALPTGTRTWLLAELKRWHRGHDRGAGTHAISSRDQLHIAQQRLLCEPVYYLHHNATTVR